MSSFGSEIANNNGDSYRFSNTKSPNYRSSSPTFSEMERPGFMNPGEQSGQESPSYHINQVSGNHR